MLGGVIHRHAYYIRVVPPHAYACYLCGCRMPVRRIEDVPPKILVLGETYLPEIGRFVKNPTYSSNVVPMCALAHAAVVACVFWHFRCICSCICNCITKDRQGPYKCSRHGTSRSCPWPGHTRYASAKLGQRRVWTPKFVEQTEGLARCRREKWSLDIRITDVLVHVSCLLVSQPFSRPEWVVSVSHSLLGD